MLLGTAETSWLTYDREQSRPPRERDLYSVGIMAWEMLTGKVPFDSDNPVTLCFKACSEDVPSWPRSVRVLDPSVAAFIAHLTARQVDVCPTGCAASGAEELSQLVAKLPLEAAIPFACRTHRR